MGLTKFDRSMGEFFQSTDPNKDIDPAFMSYDIRESDLANNVKYVEAEKVDKYKVNVGPQLSWLGRKGVGALVDCAAVHRYYKAKWDAADRSKPKRASGVAMSEGMTMDMGREWSKSLIWVVSENGTVYSSIPKIHRFHHSSFTKGEDVQSAGMWLVESGILKSIAPLSGHYKPNFGQFMNGVMTLKSAVKASKTSLFLYSTERNTFEHVKYEIWSKMTFKDLDDKFRVHKDSSSMYYAMNNQLFGSMSGSFDGSASGNW